MALPLYRTVRLSVRAQDYYNRIFRSVYQSIELASEQTPLVLMLWGPRLKSRDWSRQRQFIRDELEKHGHTVFFSEQLGLPTSPGSKKGVEFLQSEAADLIVVVQTSYGAVGEVHHFVEYRVVDSKMLLFIDEAAPDHHLYARALADLKARYDNVETYKRTNDTRQTELVAKILEKIKTIQMVKYRAIQSGGRWGLRAGGLTAQARGVKGNVQPFRYNLLELFREHCIEIDVLTDPATLFILAFLKQLGRVTFSGLSRDIMMSAGEMTERLQCLQRGELIAQFGGAFETTGLGETLLRAVGVPSNVPLPPEPQPAFHMDRRALAAAAGAGLTLAATFLVLLGILYGTMVNQVQQPIVEEKPVATLDAPHAVALPPIPLALRGHTSGAASPILNK